MSLNFPAAYAAGLLYSALNDATLVNPVLLVNNFQSNIERAHSKGTILPGRTCIIRRFLQLLHLSHRGTSMILP
mgnify:CR=1 FL=1